MHASLAPGPNSEPDLFPPDLLLSDIRVVLVAPKHAANVGAVARAAANFECTQLVLVAPRFDLGHLDPSDAPERADASQRERGSAEELVASEAGKLACGGSAAVLARARVVGSLAEALADTAGSVGFTRRGGATRLTAPSLGALMAEYPWSLPLRPAQPAQTPPSVQHGGQSQRAVGAAAGPREQAEERLAGREGSDAVASASIAVAESRGAGATALTDGEGPSAEQRTQQPGSGATGRGADGPTSRAAASASHNDMEDEDDDGGGSGGGAYVTALVFGREESGLTEDELRLCSHACSIPTGRLQPSLNLSHAVAVVLSDLFSRRAGMLEPGPVRAAAAADTSAEGQAGHRTADSHCGSTGTDASAAAATVSGVAACCTEPTSAAHEPAAAPAMDQGSMSVAGPGPGPGAEVPLLLQPASAAEVDLLVRKVAAVAEAVGLSGEEGSSGGNAGNHGRRRLPVGAVRALLGRSRPSVGESRSLHGLASALLAALRPGHPLGPSRGGRKQRGREKEAGQERERQEAGHEQEQ